MKRQILSFVLVLTTACAYYMIKHITIQKNVSLAFEKTTLVVGTNAEFMPFAFVRENGTIDGFDIEVARAVAKKLNLTISFKDLPFESLIASLQNGTVDMVAAGMNPTAERAKKVAFSLPVYEADPLVIVYPKGAEPLVAVADLAHKKVIVNEGYFADSVLSDHPDIQLIRLSSTFPSDGLKALENGQADAFVASKQSTVPALSKAQKNIFEVALLDNIMEKDAFAVALSNQPLLARINGAIAELKASGTLDLIASKWFGKEAL